MSDIGSGTFQRDVDKIIDEALKEWEKYGFKDMSLWETFQENFEGFTEEDFKSASTHNIQRLRDYLRKFGVWIRRQQRYPIARSLSDALLEEEPTKWTEEEITACEEDENFDSYKISRLIDSDFGRKPRKSRALTPTSPTGPPPAATSPTPAPSAPAFTSASTTLTPSAPAPFGSPSPTPTRSAPAPFASPSPTRVPYGMQRSGARPAAYMKLSGPTSAAYIQPSGRSTSAAYIQPPGTGLPPAAYTPPGTGPTSAAYMQPSGIGSTPAAYTQPSGIGPTSATYTQPSGTRPIPAINTTPEHGVRNQPAYTPISGTGPTPAADHTQPSNTGPAYTVQNPPPAISPPAAMITTSTGHGRELSNLAEIYRDEAKYSGGNDSSMFKLANLWKNALNSLSKNFRMGSTGRRGLSQGKRWTTWTNWDKTQDEMDETRVGVG